MLIHHEHAPTTPDFTDSRLHVLFADDDEDIRALVEVSLDSAPGIDLTLCRSAEEALERLCGQHVDLIVADLNMPGMGGLGLVDALHGRSRPPIIITTAHPDALAPGSIDPPPDAVLAKPYDAPNLAKQLRQMHTDITRQAAEHVLGELGDRFKRELPSTLAALKVLVRTHQQRGAPLPASVMTSLREITAAATMYGLSEIAQRSRTLHSQLRANPGLGGGQDHKRIERALDGLIAP
ncbi:MAG: response regulator [Gammaproteobacteria bacterium]